MKGKYLMGGLLGFTAVFAGALWYFQNYAYYVVSQSRDFDIALTLVSDGAPQAILAHDFKVLSAETSPLKFRACFTVDNSIPMLTETYAIYENATPLIPPSWFRCFDAGEISDDLETGRAVAFLSVADVAHGVDRVVAVYPDGRAYAWQQLNGKEAE